MAQLPRGLVIDARNRQSRKALKQLGMVFIESYPPKKYVRTVDLRYIPAASRMLAECCQHSEMYLLNAPQKVKS
jgi:hypothetical protein